MILLRNQRISAKLVKTSAVFVEINLNSFILSLIIPMLSNLDEFRPIREESKEISINLQKSIDYIYI